MPEELESTIYTNSGYNKHLDYTNPADGGKRGK